MFLLRQVDSLQNFTWQQQLRYYWDMDLDDCLIRHSDARVRYGYEYMGATRWVLRPVFQFVCASACPPLCCQGVGYGRVYSRDPHNVGCCFGTLLTMQSTVNALKRLSLTKTESCGHAM